jgi:Leucine-rich repeat (LRR) protein
LNQFVALANTTFQGLASLKSLSLSFNNMQALPEGIFSGLNSLTNLDLQRNRLNSMPLNCFEDLSSLNILSLSNNLLTAITPSSFRSLSRLSYLTLSFNALADLPPDAFKGLSSLSSLDLSVNQLVDLGSSAFKGLSSLEYLALDFNQLKTLQIGVFNDTTQLISLSFYTNNLEYIPAWAFSKLSNLQSLNLGVNNLETLPVGLFDGLASLTSLMLYQNKLVTFPGNIFRGLESLTLLMLGMNKIQELPEGIFDSLVNLETLDLEFNHLQSLPYHVFINLVSIQFIFLYSDWSLACIPPVHTARDHAAAILMDQRIQQCSLPVAVCAGCEWYVQNGLLLRSSTSACTPRECTGFLDFSFLGITSISPAAFAGMVALQALALSDNPISELALGSFTGMSALKNLSLSNTSLAELGEGIFHDMQSLASLDLERNNWELLPYALLAPLKSLQLLSFTQCSKLLCYPPSAATVKVDSRLVQQCPAPVATRAGCNFLVHNITLLRVKTPSCIPQNWTGTLNLSAAGISNMYPGVFSGFKNLEQLILTHNKIEALLPDVFSGLYSLQYLMLSANRLKALPATIFKDLRYLIDIKLDSNQLLELPMSVFMNLPSLQHVVMTDNMQLNCIPFTANQVAVAADRNIQVCKVPRVASCGGCDFFTQNGLLARYGPSCMPEACNGTLELSCQGITGLSPGVFSDMSSLQRLLLEGNSLSSLPEFAFDDLKNLKYLSLKENKLPALASSIFEKLFNLQTLNLSKNQLLHVPRHIFAGLRETRLLDLSWNQLQDLSISSFSALPKLETLYLNNNMLSYLPQRIFVLIGHSAPELYINLSNNRLTCYPEVIRTHLEIESSVLEPCMDQSSRYEWFQISGSAKVSKRHGHAMASVGDKIFLFGGFDSAHTNELHNNLWSSDFSKDLPQSLDERVWSTLRTESLGPQPRAYHSMAAINTTLYLYGGSLESVIDSRIYSRNLFSINVAVSPLKWKHIRMTNVPEAAVACGMAAVGDILWLFGGTGESFESLSTDELWFLNTSVSPMQWQQVGKADNAAWPQGRAWHGMASTSVVENTIFVFGGRAEESSGECLCLSM